MEMDFRELRASMCNFRTKIPPKGIPESTPVDTEVEIQIIIMSRFLTDVRLPRRLGHLCLRTVFPEIGDKSQPNRMHYFITRKNNINPHNIILC